MESFDVTITDSGESGDDPINRSNEDCSWLAFNEFTLVRLSAIAVEPSARQIIWVSLSELYLGLAPILEPNLDPNAWQQNNGCDHNQEDVDDRVGLVSYRFVHSCFL